MKSETLCAWTYGVWGFLAALVIAFLEIIVMYMMALVSSGRFLSGSWGTAVANGVLGLTLLGVSAYSIRLGVRRAKQSESNFDEKAMRRKLVWGLGVVVLLIGIVIIVIR